jgi:RNA polymerase sigma-70 factor (ECF subfamily)
VIKSDELEHYSGMQLDVVEFEAPSISGRPGSVTSITPSLSQDSTVRLAELVRREFAFVWRLVRRFGLSPADADDAAQQVFLVVSRRIDSIQVKSEKAFLFGTALRVASRMRKTRDRRAEIEIEALDLHSDPTPSPEHNVDRRRACALLDRILGVMPDDIRIVFVLYEIEQLTMAEIAVGLGVPNGTVASRLRRAREIFAQRLEEIQASAKKGISHG